MAVFDFQLSPQVISNLKLQPNHEIVTSVMGHDCSVKIMIPHHREQLGTFYQFKHSGSLDNIQKDSNIHYDTNHFGICIHFLKTAEIQLHDETMALPSNIKQLIAQFGVVIIKNAYLDTHSSDIGHRNKFPHLKFHYDRTSLQPTVYSLYTRNPFDTEQKKPREASTLFIPNIVAYLQAMKEKKQSYLSNKGVLSNYDLFTEENMNDVISTIMVEHRWDEPEGVGELSMIDNRTVLHASYYRNGLSSYRIGVRYCS